MVAARLPRVGAAVLLVPLAAAVNVALALSLVTRGPRFALMASLLPLALVVLAGLLAAKRHLLVFAALALPLSEHTLQEPFRPGSGVAIYAYDVVVILAVGSWLASRLVGNREDAPDWLRTPALGAAFVIFAAAVLVALLRGHVDNGESLLGPPVRLIAYAAIGAALAGIDARRAYRGIVAVLYAGTVWMSINAAYYIATGTTQTGQGEISTGGFRVLSGTVGGFMGSALVLALLNLRLDESARKRALHVTIALLAATNVALSYARAVYVALALVLIALFVIARRIGGSLTSFFPLAAPVVAAVALVLPPAASNLVPMFVDRVSASPVEDSSFRQRERLGAALWEQVRESPLVGVGFGRDISFSVPIQNQRGITTLRVHHAGQEGHNGFLWLLAGGGAVTLGAFLLLLLVFAADVRRRLRAACDEYETSLVLWSALSLALFVITALSGLVLSGPATLLSIWTLLLLPSVVKLAKAEPARLVR